MRVCGGGWEKYTIFGGDDVDETLTITGGSTHAENIKKVSSISDDEDNGNNGDKTDSIRKC